LRYGCALPDGCPVSDETVWIYPGDWCGADLRLRDIPASAATITYTFDVGTSFTFMGGGTGDLTGTFTIDPPSGPFSGEDVVVTGGPLAGTYAPFDNDGGEALVYRGDETQPILFVAFSSNLNSAPENPLLTSVSVLDGPDAFEVTGGATLSPTLSVPEPSTWAMTLLGFAGLGFAGWRKGKQTAVASA
jgi:PEP-CTERM motif